MNPSGGHARSCSKHIVLLGVGHTNAHIVRMWGMNPIPDTDLTCITDFPVAAYSGMLPAVLAQQVPQEEMQIDLVRLCSSVGARLVRGRVDRIDHNRQEIHVDDRPPIPFDALSIGIGSVPTIDEVKIEGESLIKIKPMQTFLQRLADKIKKIESKTRAGSLRIAVVGSGVAGVEILFCLPAFLAKHSDRKVMLSLVTRSEQILPTVSDGMRANAVKVILQRDVQLVTGQSVVSVSDHAIILANGRSLDADLVIWATGASAPNALERLGLPTDNRGFLLTDATLKSISGKPCFAGGDTGTSDGLSLPKAGVYAVRQGPVLWKNLQRLLGGRELTSYRPQQSFMKLLNCGDGKAIGQWKGVSVSGRWVMRLKEHIDRKFMRMFQPVAMTDRDDSDGEMQCRGCGCKLGADPLAEAIAMIQGQGQSIPLEDAAVVADQDGASILASTDFFTTPFDDAYLSGRVAALHSASDIIASGGRPTHALANVVLCEGDVETQKRSLADFLSGARREFSAMGASIVGGHTIVGPRMEAGFTVIGRTEDGVLRKGELCPGDLLCITKPLGIGVLLAAHMRSLCAAADYFSVVETMLSPQHDYVQISHRHKLSAMTDVTGFGLAGHLIEMLRESKVAAKMSLSDVPLLDGTARLLSEGIESTLAPDNARFKRWMEIDDHLRLDVRYKALFDPQTCGGLLFGIQPEDLTPFQLDLKTAGLSAPAVVGKVIEAEQPMLRIMA
jgi:selenide,water dikinase